MNDLNTLQQIQATLTGGSMQIRWWNPVKGFAGNEISEAAEAMNADREVISARKKVLDIHHPAWKGVVGIRTQVRNWWDHNTLPYVFSGVRLLRIQNLPEMMTELATYTAELAVAVQALDAALPDLVERARDRMGRLFDPTVYPASFKGMFGFEFRERSIEPPSYLRHTNAEEYKRQLARSLEDIGASMKKFEAQCWNRLSDLTARLQQMTSEGGAVYGSTLSNFQKLFDQVATLNFEGTQCFQEALGEAREILDGVTPEELRASQGLRQEVYAKAGAMARRFEQLGSTVAEVTQDQGLAVA